MDGTDTLCCAGTGASRSDLILDVHRVCILWFSYNEKTPVLEVGLNCPKHFFWKGWLQGRCRFRLTETKLDPPVKKT